MDDLVLALDALDPELRQALADVNDRDREGGQPRVDFLRDIDDLIPGLDDICQRRWMLELLIRLCRMRRER